MEYFSCIHIGFWYTNTIQPKQMIKQWKRKLWMLEKQQLACIPRGFWSVSDQICWCTLKLLWGQIDSFENCGISSICACFAHGLQPCFWLFFWGVFCCFFPSLSDNFWSCVFVFKSLPFSFLSVPPSCFDLPGSGAILQCIYISLCMGIN